MTSSIDSRERRSGSVHGRFSTIAFWALAVMVLVNLHWLHLWGLPLVRPVGYAVILCSCLLLLGLNVRPWRMPGTAGLLIFATVTAYLVIGGGAAFVVGSELPPDLGWNVLRQIFFFLVLLAAALGGRAILERIGIEAVLNRVFAILIASCVVMLASPVLQDLGVLPLYRLPFRLPGAFTDANDAGFVGCMTVALAAAFLRNGGPRAPAYPGLAAGWAAALGSLSTTAAVVLAATSTILLLSSGFFRRDAVLRWLPALALGHTIVLIGGYLHHVNVYPDYAHGHFCSTVSQRNPGMRRDCAILLAARDTLAGDAALNWNDSVPIMLWQGVEVGSRVVSPDLPRTWDGVEADSRVVSLDLSRRELNGRIPPELGGLDQLVSLRLNGNLLAGPIPPALESRLDDDSDAAGARTDHYYYGVMKRRPELWKSGLDKIRESPLIGNGTGRLMYMEGNPIGVQNRPRGVHNVYLLLAGEAGVVPLSLYLLFFSSLMRLRWTAPASLARDTVVGWAIVMALYGLPHHHLLTMGAFVFFAGLSCALAATCDESRTTGRRPLAGASACAG